MPIIREIQEATGKLGKEEKYGEPWEIRLPTTLVRIRPKDDLPEWEKMGSAWQEKA